MSSVSVETYDDLPKEQAEQILERITSLRAGVVGDAGLDMYWEADVTKSELSRETPHYTLPIVTERYSPGAAGNIAANFIALGCREVYVSSVIGNDWRGHLLKKQLEDIGINTSFLLTEESWITPAFCKPIRIGLQGMRQEDPRLDFQNFDMLTEPTALKLSKSLDDMIVNCDIIAVADQLEVGVVNRIIRERLSYWSKKGKIIVADSRDRIGLFRDMIVKPNEVEAARWIPSDGIKPIVTKMAEAGRRISLKVNGTCCITLGSEGAIWVEPKRCVHVPTKQAELPIDSVGAGDSFAAAMLCALGTGYEGPEAAAFANLSALITVRKLGTTGSASPREILSLFPYKPDSGRMVE